MKPRQIEIPRVSVSSPRDFREQVQDRRSPVVVVGSKATKVAVEKWSPEYFRDQFRDREYFAEMNLPTSVPTEHRIDEVQQRVTMHEFIERMLTADSTQPCYISNKTISMFPGLDTDVDFTGLVGQPEGDAIAYLWIGSAGTKASMHHDYHENILAQIYGTKRCYLVSPRYSRNLYQFPDTPQKSRVDVEAPDLERYPRYAEVEVMTTVIGPGDCLYIPNLWWHSMRSLEPSISINYFHGPRAGVKELLPGFLAAGPSAWSRFVRDFFYHGLLGVRFQQRLYASEPLGVWYYAQIRGYVRRRIARFLSREASHAKR